MTDATTIKITGPFTDAEIAEFVALLRRIDNANPTNIYTVFLEGPRATTMDEAERFLADVLPPRPYRVSTFARVAYRKREEP